ncbi:hypothetical protein CONPUDRAFT_30906, partial [Coniophora puteana RWD-64-598 SS2]
IRQSNLTGYKTPDMHTRAVVSMFADDTTVFLRKEDDFALLETILTKWCTASGAKFNINKTEVIPIGSPEYRAEVINTRQLSSAQPPLPPNVRIACDGTAVRILGAWIGNDIDEGAIWSPILDKIRDRLNHWERIHPTIEGRGILIQWFGCGMTQYLAQAQGMPPDIEAELSKLIHAFAWDNAGHAMINIETL